MDTSQTNQLAVITMTKCFILLSTLIFVSCGGASNKENDKTIEIPTVHFEKIDFGFHKNLVQTQKLEYDSKENIVYVTLVVDDTLIEYPWAQMISELTIYLTEGYLNKLQHTSIEVEVFTPEISNDNGAEFHYTRVQVRKIVDFFQRNKRTEGTYRYFLQSFDNLTACEIDLVLKEDEDSTLTIRNFVLQYSLNDSLESLKGKKALKLLGEIAIASYTQKPDIRREERRIRINESIRNFFELEGINYDNLKVEKVGWKWNEKTIFDK